eukprot:c28052_g2_i2 orf=327-782(+)
MLPINADSLTEEERRALRASRFAPLPPPPLRNNVKACPRIAHPGGPVATNKAAALAKFLQRKNEKPSIGSSLDPALVEAAVRNANASLQAGTFMAVPVFQHLWWNFDISFSNVKIRHVETFLDSDKESEGVNLKELKTWTKKKKKKRKLKM